MLGKVQQGKTSIIRALTGRDDAEIGKGFRACTRTSQVYAYPDEEGCFLKFLDTRGLGEVGYDPAEDLEVFADQSHCIIVVLNAMDHAQQDVLRCAAGDSPRASPMAGGRLPDDAPRRLSGRSRAHRSLPLRSRPACPTPFPTILARSLAAQREWFDRRAGAVRAAGFHLCRSRPAGLRAGRLWARCACGTRWRPPCRWACERWSATTSRSASGCTTRISTRPTRTSWSMRARRAAPASIPVPYIDVPVVLAIQAKLFHTIGAIYGQPMNVQQMATIASGLGIGYLARFGVRELAKLIPIPGVGSAISGAFAAASTYGLGIALCEYFGHVMDGNVPDAKMFRGWYQEAFAAAKQRFRQATFARRRSPRQ